MKLILKKDKEKALQRRHPWIFSGAFKNIPRELDEGEIVEVKDSRDNFRALGFFNRGSIAVKILSFDLGKAEDIIRDKIQAAIRYRRECGILSLQNTDCCRLIFAEGDGLPGLIVDKYGLTAVLQIHHRGWLPYLQTVADVLTATGVAEHVYSKPSSKIENAEKGWVHGNNGNPLAMEYGHKFRIDWEEGQKTGFFLDQRENRKRLADFAAGKKVLNTFSYTGGFSVYALAAGAQQVVSVDISQPAIDLANENAAINGFADRHEGIAADVFEYLQKEGQEFDIIVLDPPAFSKSRRTTHNAVQGYKRLNLLAMQKIRKGGIIFTFSCSQHINPKLFEDTVRSAAIEADRNIRILQKLSQPADHPVNIYHPEGEYLKGLILHVF